MKTTIEIRDRDLVVVAPVDDYVKLEAVLRFNAVDSWILDVPAKFAGLLGPGSGIVVRRDDEVLFSGPVTQPTRSWDASNDRLSIAGISDDCAVEDRLALPAPAPYTGAAYDARTDVAETVMLGYVDANAGPGADVDRRTVTLEADLGRGLVVPIQARFDKLGDLLRSVALAGGDLGWRVVQDGAALVFRVYEARDLSATAIFGRGLANLKAFSYTPTAPEANYAIVGGSGEGTARTFVEGGDDAQIDRWGRRIEVFVDRRDTTDAGQLAQSRDEELAKQAEKTSLTMSPIDTKAVAFLRDYYLGDRVTIMVDDTPIVDVVREVKLTIDANGETITPTVGTPGTNAPKGFLGLFASLRTIGRRVAALERRV